MNQRDRERLAAPKKKKKGRKKKKLRLLLVVELLLLIILLPLAFLVANLSKIKTYTVDLENVTQNDFSDSNINNYINIAVFGVDSRANELDQNTRSDSIIIVSIHKKTKDIKLLSIYRDTFVSIDEHGYTKINHSYAYGGPELAISTINKNFDLNISDFVTVNFSAVTNIIDMLGGVEIEITEDELDYVNDYTRDVARINGTKCVYLKSAGKQILNGTQATAYCRVRYTAGGDFTRAERQRTVMQAILKKVKSSNLKTLYDVTNEMLPQIYTSMSTAEILKLVPGIFSYDVVEQNGFPFDKNPRTINKASVVVPDTLSSNVKEMHKMLFGTENFEPSSTVQSISSEIESK
ncbi:LCP family protein [Anaeromicropila populeti]|uniref:Transcriptional attenuator, LytR family n=1 Tax=Anaeromicropila populeti TaxID=37658 RepID=A0A1I6HKX3_9FIRM|nr:LCP family protein [Anaeromicropila populeti]SFR55085.1 transcriptional attenuator, LytR family [Anaeromicropila populeti]